MAMELLTRLRALVNNDEGQDLLEYALLVALIALVCVGAIGLAGTNVNIIFGRIAGALTPSSSQKAGGAHVWLDDAHARSGPSRRRSGPARVRAAGGAHRARVRRSNRARRHERQRDLRPNRERAHDVVVARRVSRNAGGRGSSAPRCERGVMERVVAAITRLVRRSDGQDLLEYGLLAALIAVVAIAGITALGETIFTVFWRSIGQAI